MKRRRLLAITLVMSCCTLGYGTRADELTYFDENGGNGNPRGLYNFDTETGDSELRAEVGGNQRFFSLTQRASDGVVYASHVNASDLYIIDVDTGEFKFVAATGLATVADITFDPNNDKLDARAW